MKYVVTGATGFIGGRLVGQLRDAGHSVTALVRSLEKASALARIGVTLAPGDVTDPESLKRAFDGAEGIFHVAGWYKLGGRPTDDGVRVNIDGTRNVLEAMRAAGVQKGVYTSTLAVFSDTKGRVVDETYHFVGEHLSEYDRTKAEAHVIASEFMADGLPLVIVQPGVVYGPGDSSMVHDTLVQYLTGKLPTIPRGVAYCWSHVDDTAHGHVLAMEKGTPGESYIVAGEPHTLVEALQIAERLTQIPIPSRRSSATMIRNASKLAEVVERVFPVPDQYSAEALRVLAGATYLGDNAKAKRELGFLPRSLEDGLRETLAWELQNLGRELPPGL